jgi:hypothetical protein
MQKEQHYFFRLLSKGFSIVFFLLLHPLSIKAQDTLIYAQNQPWVDVGGFHIDYENLSWTRVQALPDTGFQKSKASIMNFANTMTSIGIRLFIKN